MPRANNEDCTKVLRRDQETDFSPRLRGEQVRGTWPPALIMLTIFLLSTAQPALAEYNDVYFELRSVPMLMMGIVALGGMLSAGVLAVVSK